MTPVGASLQFTDRPLLLAILPLFELTTERASALVTSNRSKNQYDTLLHELKLLKLSLPRIEFSSRELGGNDSFELVQSLCVVLDGLENLIIYQDLPGPPHQMLPRYPKLRRLKASGSQLTKKELHRLIQLGGSHRQNVKFLTFNLKSCNSRITEFTDQTMPKPPMVKSRDVSTSEHHISEVRRHTTDLFYALHSLKSPSCRQRHAVMLQLATHTHHYQTLKQVKFSVVITNCHRQRWQDCKICVKIQSRDASKESREERSSVSLDRIIRVGFIVPDTDETTKYLVKPDLCTWIRSSSDDEKLLSMLVEDEQLWYIKSAWPRICDEELSRLVSLDDILQHNKATDLTLKTRRILAVLLAHALVQLGETPWLRDEWNRNDIYFTQRRLPETNKFDIRGPYIRTSMEAPQTRPQDPSGRLGGAQGIQPIHPLPSLLNLGIILLEIESGYRLESYKGYLKDSLNSKAKIALDKVDHKLKYEKNDLFLDGFWEAIRSCLDPKFIPRNRISEKTFVRCVIRENIILPLEKALEIAQGVKAMEIDDIIQDEKEIYLKNDRGDNLWIIKTENSESFSTIISAGHSQAFQPLIQQTTAGNSQNRKPTEFCVSDRNMESFEAECSLFDDGSISQDEKRHKASAQWVAKLSATVHKMLPLSRDISKKRVRIAILDTGIDRFDEVLLASKERIICGRSWVDNEKGDENVADEFGHGTHTTALLCTAAPEADIYVGRICKGKILKDVISIAKALQWAISCEVDIITMSLGFSRSFKDFDLFTKAIGPLIAEASRKDIIMFAAAGNGGGFNRVGYPAMSPKVIPVFSTDGFAAKRSEFSPLALKEGISISALGEDIESSWPGHLDESHKQIKSGTSFATPLVAGFAASLIEYGRQNLSNYNMELEHLESHTGMEAVLKIMARRQNEETKYYDLQPWDFFDDEQADAMILRALKESLYRS